MDVVKDLDCESVDEGDLVSCYVTHRLSEGDAEAFEKHYLGCDRCSGELQAALEIRAAFGAKPASAGTRSAQFAVRALPPRTAWRLLAAAAAIGALALSGVLLISRQRHASTGGLAALIDAADQSRVVEPRLTGGFRYVPLERATRGSEGDRRSAKLKSAAYQVLARQSSASSAESLHAAGIAHLLLGDWDDAVTSLEKASEVRSADAHLWSDVAGAYLARGKQKDQAQDFARALTAVEKALRLDPVLPEALFNRALILESLQVQDQAKKAWEAYLRQDAASGWASEARERLLRLAAPTQSERWEGLKGRLTDSLSQGDRTTARLFVKAFRQQSRIYVEEELLPGWAAAQSDHREREAGTILRAAQGAAEILAEESHDELLLDSVRTIRASLAMPFATGRLRDLVEGHRHYGIGRRLYQKVEIEPALKELQASEALLSRGGSPFSRMVTVWIVASRIYQKDYEECRRLLDQLESTNERDAQRYRSLSGRIQWQRGITLLGTGSPYESLENYQASLAIFEDLRETENAAAVHGLLADAFRYLGDSDRAWTHRHKSLALLREVGESFRVNTTWTEAAITALREGYFDLALLASDTLRQRARLEGNPVFGTEALLWRCLAHEATGGVQEASRDLARARLACLQIRDGKTREATNAQLDLAEARLARRRSPLRAIDYLTRALDFFSATGSRVSSARVLGERAALRIQQGDLPAAKGDLLAAVGELERQRGLLREEPLRISYFQTARNPYLTLARLAGLQGDVASSFHFAESAKARSLLDDTLALPGAAPLSVVPMAASVVMRQMPDRIAVVSFAIFEDRTFAWILRRENMRLVDLPVSEAILRSLARNFSTQSEGRRSLTGPPANFELYDRLIRPLLADLTGQDVLVLVPDGCLEGLPFSALRNRDTRRFLTEDYRIAVAPSVTLFLETLARTKKSEGASERVLVISNPRVDKKLFPELPELRQAAREAGQVAKLFPGSTVFQAEDATRSRFLAAASHSSLIHFGGHAVVNRPHPFLSALIFAPDPFARDTGLLYARDISSLRLVGTRLVVLAACETAAGPSYSGEGSVSLARAFLAAGVPSVLASLWPVDDTASAALLSHFYEDLRSGADPITALRASQVALLKSPDPTLRDPSAWAPFQLIGGVAPN